MPRKRRFEGASEPTPPQPRKNKKYKKRQKAASEQSKASTSGQATPPKNGNNPAAAAKTHAPTAAGASPRKRNRGSQKASKMNNDIEMYGEELPVPPSPQVFKSSAKGKARAVDSNIAHTSMEDGEVDEMDGLFFVDTAPSKLHKDVKGIDRPVIARKGSPSLAPPALSDAKVVPDYVGSSNEVRDANVIQDDGFVEGSSKDLANAITHHHSNGINGSSETAGVSKQQQNSTSIAANDAVTAADSSGAPASVFTSPGGTKRKREEETSGPAPKRVSDGTTMLLGDLQSDESTSSEDEEGQVQDVDDQQSVSDGESSAQGDGADDDLALNMAFDMSGTRKPPPPPQLDMQIDLTGTPVPPDEAAKPSAHVNDGGIHIPENEGTGAVSAGNGILDAADDIPEENMEGIENDDYQADRSRYFKEDDPLKLCARCGETGHTVRDCAHVQCLTCGKLDDHGTRSCPLTMTCFRCNSRGHHIKEARSSINQFCERCSSHTHKSSTCPYIWRVYIRAADAPVKPPKIHFACYNCASGDHFGDDCKLPRGHPIMNTERTAFTMDPDNHRKTHIRFDTGSSSSMSRPGTANGKSDVSPPPSHAPRGPRAMQKQAAKKEKPKPASSTRPSLEDVLYSLEQERRKTGDFGDLGDLEAGEIDEDEDAFEKRLLQNAQEPKQPRGPRPGARDRRRAREGGGGSKTNTDSSTNGDKEPKKSFQPFKNFAEPPALNGSSLNRPRSLSRSPPPQSRRRETRQPSPVAMDSPAQAKSAEQWKKGRGLQDRLQHGRGAGRGGFASGSLLDRIDRGSNASNDRRAPASRDPRNYDDRERNDRGDYDERPRDSREVARDSRRDGRDNHVRDGEPASGRGGNPRYRGGYF